jgi:hypothetical protein
LCATPTRSAIAPARNLSVVFVLDESGSMGADAVVQVGSTVESTGQNNLGVVCTAVAAAQAVMPPSTESGVVMFSSSATCLSPIVPMSDEAKASIKSSLLRRQPTDSTNLESGVTMAIDMLRPKFRELGSEGEYVIVVLTDGQPDTERAYNGEHYGNYFRSYSFSKSLGFQPKIYTAGFGYNVKVDLLGEISRITGGHFSFIPTPDMAATNFINLMSHLLSQEPPLSLAPEVDSYRKELVRLCPEMCRFGNVGDSAGALAIVRGLSTRIRAAIAGMPESDSRDILSAYLMDVEGEIALCFSNLEKNYNVWGRGYIPSLARAHETRICANYKDPGLQVYAGPRFKAIQEVAAEKFRSELADSISKMEPSSGATSSSFSRGSLAAILNLYNPAGGCFDGASLVKMADGSMKPAKSIQRGDRVCSFSGEPAEVFEVVKTKIDPTAQGVVFKSGLKITGWHPVFIDGRWTFPSKAPSTMIETGGTTAVCGLSIVYSFAVRAIISGTARIHGMVVDGIPVATLGHGVTGDEVLSHTFYGTHRVIDAIRNMRENSAKDGLDDPIVGDGPWCWVYDEKGSPVGIAKK